MDHSQLPSQLYALQLREQKRLEELRRKERRQREVGTPHVPRVLLRVEGRIVMVR